MKADFEKWMKDNKHDYQSFYTIDDTEHLINQFAEDFAKQEVTRNLLKTAIVSEREKKQEALSFIRFMQQYDEEMTREIEPENERLYDEYLIQK